MRGDTWGARFETARGFAYASGDAVDEGSPADGPPADEGAELTEGLAEARAPTVDSGVDAAAPRRSTCSLDVPGTCG